MVSEIQECCEKFRDSQVTGESVVRSTPPRRAVHGGVLLGVLLGGNSGRMHFSMQSPVFQAENSNFFDCNKWHMKLPYFSALSLNLK